MLNTWNLKNGKYSQNQEDLVILELFGDHIGRYLDIGAANGVELSNTRLLAESGWSGVAVEPHPKNYAALVDNYADFPSVKTINRAVRAESCIGNIYFQRGDQHLWWSTGHRKQYESELEVGARQFDVVEGFKYIGVEELFTDGGFDFVSIDTDGFDFEIMCRLCQIKKPKVFCAEVCGNDVSLNTWLWYFSDYQLVLRTTENIIMRHIGDK